MKFSYDDNYIITRCRDATMNFYRIKHSRKKIINRKLADTIKLEFVINIHFESPFAPFALSPDNHFFAVETIGHSIEIWDY